MSSSAAGRDLVVEPVAGWRVWRLTTVSGVCWLVDPGAIGGLDR